MSQENCLPQIVHKTGPGRATGELTARRPPPSPYPLFGSRAEACRRLTSPESLAGRRDRDSSFQDGVVLVARAIQEHVRRSFLQAGESLLRAESPIVL